MLRAGIICPAPSQRVLSHIVIGSFFMMSLKSSSIPIPNSSSHQRLFGHDPWSRERPPSTQYDRPVAAPMFACPLVCKARGEPAKGHPVVRRLLSLRGLLSSLSPLDAKLEPQMQVLLSALEAGVDLRGSDDGSEDSEDDGDDDDNEDEQGNAESDGDSAAGGTDAARSEDDFDEGNLEEEENMFMGAGNASSEDEIDEGQLSPAAIKKRKKEARKKAKVKARGEAALRKEKGVGALDDFGDEDTDDLPTLDKRGGGDNLLQGMMNRISQRERMSGKRSALQGDLDVPVRERDMTIRVRRPAPGESDDDNSDDLGLGADGLMGGLPPELLQGITHGKKGSKANKRTREEQEEKADAATCDGEDEENAFYASVAKDKQAKKRVKDEKYKPKSRIAGALEAELEAERAARGGGKRGANYAIIKNKGLTPHKNKLNRNPRVKKRNAYQKALTRRKGQVCLIKSFSRCKVFRLGINVESLYLYCLLVEII